MRKTLDLYFHPLIIENSDFLQMTNVGIVTIVFRVPVTLLPTEDKDDFISYFSYRCFQISSVLFAASNLGYLLDPPLDLVI